ncbi:MAG: hypothetical protein HQL37_14170 [Alphaproteobacteria bacterium]|nr:hypothetical protein [Alphaproteobacteria bacterium]
MGTIDETSETLGRLKGLMETIVRQLTEAKEEQAKLLDEVFARLRLLERQVAFVRGAWWCVGVVGVVLVAVVTAAAWLVVAGHVRLTW